jgi:hypothetical protein
MQMMATARSYHVGTELQQRPPSYTAAGRLHGIILTLRWNNGVECILPTALDLAMMAVSSPNHCS